MRITPAIGFAVIAVTAIVPACSGKETSRWSTKSVTLSDFKTARGNPCTASFRGTQTNDCVGEYEISPSLPGCQIPNPLPAALCAEVCQTPNATCVRNPKDLGTDDDTYVYCQSTATECTTCQVEKAGETGGCLFDYFVWPSLEACGFGPNGSPEACARICGNATDVCSVYAVDPLIAQFAMTCAQTNPFCESVYGIPHWSLPDAGADGGP